MRFSLSASSAAAARACRLRSFLTARSAFELNGEIRAAKRSTNAASTPSGNLADLAVPLGVGELPPDRGHPDHWIVKIHRTGVPVGDVEVHS